jgi:hypothetical protein
MASPLPKAAINQLHAVASAPAPAFPGLPNASGVGVEAMDVSVVPRSGSASSTPVLIAAPRTVIVGHASRASERSVLPGCDGVVGSTHVANGAMPARSLCTLWDPRRQLRADAAIALAKLNVAYKQHFGDNLCLSDAYRTIAEQRLLRVTRPGLAAVPGTSEHGYGLAVDLCDGIERGGGSRFQWMRAHAADYGWANPVWAQGGSQYEPWHWEYVAGE